MPKKKSHAGPEEQRSDTGIAPEDVPDIPNTDITPEEEQDALDTPSKDLPDMPDPNEVDEDHPDM